MQKEQVKKWGSRFGRPFLEVVEGTVDGLEDGFSQSALAGRCQFWGVELNQSDTVADGYSSDLRHAGTAMFRVEHGGHLGWKCELNQW